MSLFTDDALKELAKHLAPLLGAEMQKGGKRGAGRDEPEWPETMTIDTVAKFLDCPTVGAARSLMENLEKAGEIVRCELDGRVRYRKSDLLRLIERKTGS